jgi:GNAT superfamily N-acetyltransferase
VPRLVELHGEAMEANMALGATPETDLEAFHRAALGEPGRVVLLAEVEGQVVGMAHIAPSGAANARHRAEVQRVVVGADARGAGVGRELMEAVEEVALARGLTLLWLTTHDASEACAFYEAIGYTKLGVMQDYSQRPDGGLAPAAFYYKVLKGSS